MFFKSLVVPFVTSARAVALARQSAVHVRHVPPRPGEGWASRMTGVAVRAHLLIAPSRADATGLVASNGARNMHAPHALRRLAIQQLHRATMASARACLRAAFAGRPLTPGGYAVLAAMVTAVALVALFSALSAGTEPERALCLCGWFY